jgi:hypothetical protein
MDQSTHDVRRTNWLNIIHQCQNRPSGTSVKQWLAENDIKEKAYYYWLRKFRKEACDQMQLPTAAAKTEVAFAEITMPLLPAGSDTTAVNASDAPSAAVIRYNGLTIELSNDISEGLLNRLLREVYHA